MEAENDEDALRDMFALSDVNVEDVAEDKLDEDGGSAVADAGGESERASGPRTVKWLWDAELNPSRSLRERRLDFDRSTYLQRETSFMSENCSWQCLVGVKKKPMK